MTDASFGSLLKSEYLRIAAESIGALNTIYLSLAVGDALPERALRCLRDLKIGARAVALDDFAAFVARLAEILERMHASQAKLSAEHLSMLVRGNDCLRREIDDLERVLRSDAPEARV